MIEQIINKFDELGINLWCECGQLHYKAPKGLIKTEYLEEIRANKSEIISYLNNEKCLRLEKALESNGRVKYVRASKSEDDNNRILIDIEDYNNGLRTLDYDSEKIRENSLSVSKSSIEGVDKNLVSQWVGTANKIALYEMMNLFVKKGVFIENDIRYPNDEIAEKICVSQKYKRFMERWIQVLVKEGLVAETENGYRRKSSNEDFNTEEMWKKLYELEDKLHYGEGFVKYLKKCSENLDELFKGDVTPLELLFPHGETSTAVDTYQKTLTSRILNNIASNCALNIVEQCEKKDEVFRILEVGAGVGGTSDSIIEKIGDHNIEYYYTDLSTFFLNKAKERYKGRNNIKYGIFDINKGLDQDIVKDKKFDLIVCANVLHNAKNGPEIIRMLQNLSVNNGVAIILDAINEPYYFLTSIEFNDGLRDFEDFRKSDNSTFFEMKQWINMFETTGTEIISSLPDQDSEWCKFGQGIFVVKLKDKEKNITHEEIRRYLSERLTQSDMPDEIRINSSEFIKENLKNNKETVNEEVKSLEYEKPIGEIENKLERIWASVLNRDNIGRNENFFLIGGDSLLVSQVIAKIWDEIPETTNLQWGEIMKEILETPTIADMAKKIEMINSKEKDKNSNSYVTLLNSDSNEKVSDDLTYVLFHAGTGTLTPYITMVNLMKKDNFSHDVIGFTSPDYDLYKSIDVKDLFKNIGINYAQSLLKSGKKKFVFIGHCIGGLIALEAAKELKRHDVDVEKVILISTNLCDKKVNSNINLDEFTSDVILEKVFGRLIGADYKKAGYIIDDVRLKSAIERIKKDKNTGFDERDLCELDDEFKDVSLCYSKLLESNHEERLIKLYNTLDKYDENVLESKKDLMNQIYGTFKQNFLGTLYYTAENYDGNVSVLKCKQETENFFINIFNEFSDDLQVWKNYFGENMTFNHIEGDHISCMNSPYIDENIKMILGDLHE